MLECERWLKDLGILVTFLCILSTVNERMRMFWRALFLVDVTHSLGALCILLIEEHVPTYGLNPVLSQEMTAFTLSLLGCSEFSVNAYTSICAFGADTKHCLLV